MAKPDRDAVLALDQGTTSSRALVLHRDGRVLGLAQRELPQSYPRPGWVEHDPVQIWQTQLEVARTALQRAGVAAAQVAAIGITNQRETTILWDRASGKALAPAIVWQDRRTADDCRRLRASPDGRRIAEATGLQLDPYFSATKVRWLLEHLPGARRRAEDGEIAFGTVDSWLVWNLTGGRVHATDPSNASRTLLFDLRAGGFSAELCAALQVPAPLLPRVVDSSGVFAETEPALFGAPIALGGIAGDQQAALFGQVCVEPGRVKSTYGTGCFLLMNTGPEIVRSRNGLLGTVAWRIGGATTYALEGSVFVGGALVQWLRDGLGLIERAADIEPLAASVPDSGGVYCVPAFTGLGAPHWDPYARGTIVGLTRGTTAGHLARAALDAIAHQVADVVGAMESDAGLRLQELRVDGGAAANDLLLRLQAELLGVPVVRPAQLETTALGAAYLAGLAAGTWQGTDELAARWRESGRFLPGPAREQAAGAREGWRRALERARGWIVPDAGGQP